MPLQTPQGLSFGALMTSKGEELMTAETYEYSKEKARKRRLREAATAIPGILVIAFLAALYVENPIAHHAAKAIVEHWNWVAAGAVALVVFGVCAQARH